MKRLVLLLAIIGALNVSIFGQNKWLGGTGDYDNPNNWSDGTVPTLNDEVLIVDGHVNLSANQIHYAGNLTVENDAILDFEGEDLAGANIQIAGNVNIGQSVTIQYDVDGSHSQWIFVGSNVNHEVNVKGKDLNYIYLDVEDSQIELLSPVTASRRVQIKKGFLETNSQHLTTGTFRPGGGCSGPSCPSKTLNLGSSIVSCDLWDATFNYGSITINGNYTIKAAQFQGGADIQYHNVDLTEFDAGNSGPFSELQLASRNNTFEDLTISNSFDTKLAGDLTVNGVFKVTQQNVNILITKESNSCTNQWTFNGSVDLVEDQGGCYDFTVFSKHSSVADDFTFQSANSLVFDWAIIHNIPTSGGGSFTVDNGYVAGYNSDWNNGQQIAPKNLYWIGGDGQWSDGTNWSLSSGGSPYGCPPSIRDNAFFDEASFTSSSQSVDLLYFEDHYCRNFIWKPMTETATIADISQGLTVHPNLYISGAIDIEMPDIFDFDGADLYLVANDEYGISSDSPLPYSIITSSSSSYLQEQDLVFDKSLEFNAGYYSTEGYDLQVNGSLFCKMQDPKEFDMNGSLINVTNTAHFGDIYGNGNITVNAGTSHIICNKFQAVTNDFDVVESNSTTTYFINPDGDNLYIRKFILNGAAVEIYGSGIDLDSLVLNSNNATLGLAYGHTSNIYRDIVVNVTAGNYATLEGKYIGAFSNLPTVNFPNAKTCILGPIEIEDIIASSIRPVNVPDGIDGGGNTNFDFTPDPTYSGTLYWIAGDGEMMEEMNWSTRSGGCPAGVDAAIADQLIFDSKGFTSSADTVRVSSTAYMKKVRWENIEGAGVFTNFHTTSTVYAEEWVVKDTYLKMSSPSNRSLFVDHHLHADGATLTVDNMSFLIASEPSTLDDVALHIKESSVILGNDLTILLRGQAADASQATFKVDPNSLLVGNGNSLYTYPPSSGQPLRNMTIEANNAHFDIINLFYATTGAQSISINDNIRCNQLLIFPNPNGEVKVTSGHMLEVLE